MLSFNVDSFVCFSGPVHLDLEWLLSVHCLPCSKWYLLVDYDKLQYEQDTIHIYFALWVHQCFSGLEKVTVFFISLFVNVSEDDK